MTEMQTVIRAFWAALFFCSLTPNYAIASEYLSNRSFELPVAPNNGNNFFASVPNWTLTPTVVVASPFNIVVPTAAYANNPQATPVGGGRQYLDIRNTGGVMAQTVTFPSTGIVSMSTWFSQRDAPRNLTGMGIRLKDASGTIVASGFTQFFSTDPISLWKQVSVTGITVLAGTYTFEVIMDNFNNIDLASVDFVAAQPALEIVKSADKTGPLVAGELVTYTFLVRNSGNIALTNVGVVDDHQGAGATPVIGSETIHTDIAPTGDSNDPSVILPSSADGIWSTLGIGDTVRFRSTYIVTQQDVDTLQ